MKSRVCTLSDADIASRRAVNRRTLLSTLGIGAGLASLAAAGAHAQGTVPKPEPAPKPPERRDPCRDRDHAPPSDTDGCGKPPTS